MQVRMLHSLDHPNVLKFYSWYETSAHLWLVLEYCVGGDLMTLLKQDNQLPEDSIHDLARDLVRALQFLHSKGVIYCDLKPSNILLDENGCMKLCDFGLAIRLSEIEKSSLNKMLQAKRGTPCYMAPELFQEGGVHSYASDFWALGCVLYECYVGRPPFVGNEFTELVNSILSDPIPPLPGNPTKSLVNLIDSLLVKDPAERIQWSELCQHSFWRTTFTLVPLPPQLAFNNMLQLFAKPCLSERNGDRPSQQRTPPKRRENHGTGVLKQNENFSSGNKVLETPSKNAQSARKAQPKSSGRVENKHKETFNAGKAVNLLRLSRVAKMNLQRENEKENYRRPLPKTSENDTEVKIENHDMELDFSENPEDDAPDESDSENPACTPGEKMPVQNANEVIEEIEHNENQSEVSSENTTIVSDDIKKLEQDLCLQLNEVAATPPSINHHRKGQRIKGTPGTVPDSESSRSSNNLSEVFWHPTDLSVKPVMPSRKGDKVSDAVPLLPYAVPILDYAKLPPEQLITINNRIIDSLSRSSQDSEKHNAIRYLEMLSGNADAANVITNGPVMLLLVKMLKLSKVPALRVQVASVLGLLIRHSTYIKADLANSSIINYLTVGLRDKQEKVRRFCMAALGELLFYISTQDDSEGKDNNPIESPSKDNRHASGWQVPSSVLALVASILRKGEDDVTQLYALRTIENICSQGGDWTSRFACQDVIGNLCYIYKATGKQESTRLIAGSCLVRLARFNPSCIQFVFDKLSLKDIASSAIKGSSREQQISLNLLNTAILSHTIGNISRHLVSLVEEKSLIPGILSLIEQGSEVLRGKALIFVALLCKNSRRWLPHFLCNAKLLSAVDRLVKEKDAFIQQCVEAFIQLVASTVPGILETVSGDILQMMGGKRRGAIAALTGRNNSKGTAQLFPVILHLLGSSSFKHRVVNSHVLLQLANLIKLLEAPFQGRDDFQITLLQVLETITEEPSVIQGDPKTFTSRILPSLSILYKGNKDGDARFLCLKILFDVMVVFFNDTSANSLTENVQIKDELKSISETYFLPLYPTFIEDDDPIPMYAQKLLVMLVEFNYLKVSDILHLKTVSQCFEFLLCDLSNANVSDVKLCLALVSAPEMDSKVLSHLQVVRKIGNLLEFVNAKEMEDFLEPTLGLCKAFIMRSIGTNKAMAISKEPSLLGNTAFERSMDVDQQYYVKDISEFSSNISAFLELIGNPEVHVTDLASECVVLLLKAAPREATMGLLTNLSKMSSLFAALHHRSSGLQLQRLLYALSFSCQQYLSHAMILSISIPDVKRIEVLISDLKSSTLPGVSEAAFSLSLELQRLPRCV
ncbi:uncharacterized protein A4U43_C07F15170 [Asparagus officinalis]|uniref:Protein kinase domain-containing protein n=1 Tax=Asparagus officinalis TaxID=4686 RepID=A0A5P1EF21_ASPOF|nr:serine/threonine-protein kinase RUNKEL [Asparagus officinalis]ONK63439.1 uncharacterized protein A4U43_C07F15170 [Asparagus officinalis]